MPPRPTYLDWGDRNDPWAGGVYYKCRDYWIVHAQARQLLVQNTSCPFGPFAADIVNHFDQDPSNHKIDDQNCGKWIEGNSGERGANKNPILHAEVEATFRLMDCNLHPENCVMVNGVLTQTQAQNKTYWGLLTMYSTGESCAEDATAEVLAGYREVIYGVPTIEQIEAGWQLPGNPSKDIYNNARTPTIPKNVFSKVGYEQIKNLYFWQYQPHVPCPLGCLRSGSGASITCVKQTL